MMLQVNNTGAWKTVLRFKPPSGAKVRELVDQLGQGAAVDGYRVSFRIVDEPADPGAMPRVRYHWTPQRGWARWRDPAGAAGADA